jgi:hypothetical protein
MCELMRKLYIYEENSSLIYTHYQDKNHGFLTVQSDLTNYENLVIATLTRLLNI